MSIADIIFKHKIVAIIRGANPADALSIITALADAGINLVEVTMNSPSALEVISQACKNPPGNVAIGAGTVLDVDNANKAIDAGARFIISPSFNKDVIEITRKRGAVSIPGAFTPTEIVSAYSAGGDIIKVFPASIGVQYIKDLRGPLPHIPLMPTGGINLGNIAAFFQAGAVAAGIGSALVDTHQKVTEEYLRALKQTAVKFIEAIKNI